VSARKRLALDDAAQLVRPRDTLLCGLATGQAIGVLEALGKRDDFEDLIVFGGLFARPYALVFKPGVRVLSGFFGPVERAAVAAGVKIEYLAADFAGLERLALRLEPRVVLALTSEPDADGWLSFGPYAGASYRPFVEATRDPARVAIAEMNPNVPRLSGLPAFGDNRIHVDDVDACVENEVDLPALPRSEPTDDERRIAHRVVELLDDGSTLQFGIGGIPDEVARLLAAGPHADFGIHTEMISDGVMYLHEADSVSNQKGLYDGATVATFALGSSELYGWLDGNPAVKILPVSQINDVAVIRRLRRFASINGALAVDLLGQVAADHVGGRQHSGVGGHESFVAGATEAPGGKSFLCLPSVATVHNERISTIVPRLDESTTVTTPRHRVQYVVTEQGAVDLSALGERERARALVDLAHPDFRDALRARTG
jgi:acyl-CoA hydrolase